MMGELTPKEATAFVEAFADGGAEAERAAILEMVRERMQCAVAGGRDGRRTPEGRSQKRAVAAELRQLAADIEARGKEG